MSEGANAGEATAAVAEGEAISESYVDAEGKAHLSSEFSDLKGIAIEVLSRAGNFYGYIRVLQLVKRL